MVSSRAARTTALQSQPFNGRVRVVFTKSLQRLLNLAFRPVAHCSVCDGGPKLPADKSQGTEDGNR